MITAIVLAGGQSSRMGRPKQLLHYDGSTLLRRVVDNLLLAGVKNIVLVLGHAAEQIEASLQGLPLSFVINKDYAKGLSSSLQAGLKVLRQQRQDNNLDQGRSQAVLFVLGDQPLVKVATIQAIIEAYQPGKIVVPFYKSQRGNPVLFDSCFLPELENLQGDVGARPIIARHPEALVKLEVNDPGILQDIDTWADYQELTKSP